MSQINQFVNYVDSYFKEDKRWFWRISFHQQAIHTNWEEKLTLSVLSSKRTETASRNQHYGRLNWLSSHNFDWNNFLLNRSQNLHIQISHRREQFTVEIFNPKLEILKDFSWEPHWRQHVAWPEPSWRKTTVKATRRWPGSIRVDANTSSGAAFICLLTF